MKYTNATREELLDKIASLEREKWMQQKEIFVAPKGNAVIVPDTMKPLFDFAQQTVAEYFRHLKMDPAKGTIEINDQRYVLVRASALSKDFLDTVKSLYADRGESEAMSIGKNFLFDISHVIGMNDAKNFHSRMDLTDSISKLSAGPVHFAYSGWAFVEILPESRPSPDENCYLIYNHPYSFEADSWVRSGKKSETPVCIMNAGYSSGWCEESFGIPLTAVEVSCIAKGDAHCTFIMSPPEKIQGHVDHYFNHDKNVIGTQPGYEIPTFFDRKRVEEEMQKSKQLAEASAKSKADFVANMSHELRTPLGVILGFTDQLQKTKLDARQKDYLEAVLTAGNSLLAIINDILDLSKLDAGKFNIECIAFSLPELMHSMQVMFLSKAKQKNLQITCKVDPAINFPVLGDPMRLTQILINILSNSLKFTETGSVSISCILAQDDENGLQIVFSVSDTGIGIPEDKLSEVFERFTQADTNITRKYGGTGLGLHITKQLIDLQGGSIILKNNIGGGVEFSFTLPYTKAPGIMPLVENTIWPGEFKIEVGKRVLVVEDNIMNQKLASIILQSNGMEVMLAENGEKAIEILKKQSFDVILMDIQMPLMDGYKATELIRSELQISTPIIAMTAHVLAGEKTKCLQAGMNDYISKPFDEKSLLMRIAHHQFLEENKTKLFYKQDEKIISLDFLKQQSKSNTQFIAEMIEIFIIQTPDDINALQAAINEPDFKGIYKSAHSLRNTIGFFGLINLLNHELIQIEQLSLKQSDLNDIKKCFEKVKIICIKAVRELKEIKL